MRSPDNPDMSAGQKKVMKFLVDLGLVVESEKQIGPFWVDCYLPELTIVVEFDGPYIHHSKAQNQKRDDRLTMLGVKKILHIRGTSKEELENLAKELGAR